MSDAPLPIGDPTELGFDPDRLAQLGPAMQHFVDSQKVPNLVTLLARKGQIVHFESRGVLDIEQGNPVGMDSLFRMYSNTKPIAGVATLILFEKGILTPDDPVARFLPEWGDLQVVNRNELMLTEPAKRPLTIRHCLTNTTGLMSPQAMPSFYRQQMRDELASLGYEDDDGFGSDIPNRDRVRAMAKLPLGFHPGERFVYHVGYPILSAVLEEACGQTLDVFFEENIFEPLKMDSTDFYLKPGTQDRFGTNYVPREVEGEVKLHPVETAADSEKNGPRKHFGGGGDAGGVLSTAGDYARFGQMLLNGGELDGARILGRKTVDLMVGNHTGDMTIPMTGRGFHWGLGVATYHGRGAPPLIRSVGTYGWGGAAGTTYFGDPQEELLGVCLTQVLNHGAMPGNNYQETFQRLSYQALV
ncbi:MAG: beta-lactamase family protein [Pseudomonadales bacterium]|nr:beta-lactamase family protein [Pseudomonadales bacterium]